MKFVHTIATDFFSFKRGQIGYGFRQHRRKILRHGFAVGEVNDRLVDCEWSNRRFEQRGGLLVLADHDHLRVRP